MSASLPPCPRPHPHSTRLLALAACPALCFALALTGCVDYSVGVVAPRPAISLAASERSLALAIAPRIADAFCIRNGTDEWRACALPVKGFRSSLGHGFTADLLNARSALAEALALMFEKVATDGFVPLAAAGGQR